MSTISPGVPRQNSVMERRWRQMGEDARFNLVMSKLPIGFWWEAWQDGQQKRRCIPFADDPSQCPWSVWTGKPAPSAHLRVFGCVVYRVDYSPATKMNERGLRCIHLGRAPTSATTPSARPSS